MSWPLVAGGDTPRDSLVAPFGFRRVESAFALLAAPGGESRALAIVPADGSSPQGALTPHRLPLASPSTGGPSP